MSYLPGTYIDLSYMNKPKLKKNSPSEATGRLFDVGTQFIFSLTNGQLKTGRRIEVAMA